MLPYTFYAAHRGDLTAHTIDGIAPTGDSITAGRYPLIERVYVYVKNQHMGRVPGLQRLVYEFTSERAISPTGYVAATWIVALDDIGRNRARDMALSLQPWRPGTGKTECAQHGQALRRDTEGSEDALRLPPAPK